jgi:hypothetical protein
MTPAARKRWPKHCGKGTVLEVRHPPRDDHYDIIRLDAGAGLIAWHGYWWEHDPA